MSAVTVYTQAEFDEAVEAGVDEIMIRSESGVWIEVKADDSSTVRAFDSSTVKAYGSSKVTSFDSSTVWAYGSSAVKADDSSAVEAYGSSAVEAYGSSAVTASGFSTVEAYGSSTVEAFDSSTVKAYGSSKVTSFDASKVKAFDSSTVWAYDSSTVTASRFVAVHVFSERVTLGGNGHVIDLTALDMKDPATWCDYHGVQRAQHDGVNIAFLYKAVNSAWSTERGWDYSPGSTPEAKTWKPNGACGDGLHFSPRPDQAARYIDSPAHFVRVGVRIDELSLISDEKAKARRVVVPCVEVDINGKDIS